jgi:aspartate dehydrogenase
MATTRRIGLIGLGAIGRIVAGAVDSGKAGDWRIDAVLTRSLPRPARAGHVADPAAFFPVPVDLYIECAGPAALASLGEEALRRADVWSVSGAALADTALSKKLEAVGRASGHRLRLVSGAIGGLDALQAFACAPGLAVEVSVAAPDLAEPFEAAAVEAARLLPNGVNVAVAAALAGAGLERTRVRLARGPGNERELTLSARGALGSLRTALRPVTDPSNDLHIVASSLIAALRQADQTIWVG